MKGKGLIIESIGKLFLDYIKIVLIRCMGKVVLLSIDFSFSIGTCLLGSVMLMILTFFMRLLKSTSVIQ